MPASDRIVGSREYGGVLVIEGVIANRSIRLLVDTGAAVTVISPVAADRLGLPRDSFTGRRRIAPAGGISVQVPTGRIPLLQLGTFELRDVEVALMDLLPGLDVDGLLGVNVLDRFRVTFELRHATLVLRQEPLR